MLCGKYSSLHYPAELLLSSRFFWADKDKQSSQSSILPAAPKKIETKRLEKSGNVPLGSDKIENTSNNSKRLKDTGGIKMKSTINKESLNISDRNSHGLGLGRSPPSSSPKSSQTSSMSLKRAEGSIMNTSGSCGNVVPLKRLNTRMSLKSEHKDKVEVSHTGAGTGNGIGIGAVLYDPLEGIILC